MCKNRPAYPSAAKSTLRLGSSVRFAAVVCLLLGLLLLGLMLNVNIGSVQIEAGNVLRMLWDGIRYSIANVFTGGQYRDALDQLIHASTESQILFSIRIPRMLLAILLGGALSLSGYLLQVFFRNPIAGPFELGISSGAKMVVGVTLIFLSRYLGSIRSVTLILAAFIGSLFITGIPFELGISSGAKMVVGVTLIFLSRYLGSIRSVTLILAAFIGSLFITGIVLLFSQKVNNMSMLLVIGIMVGYICSAVTDFCVTFADDHDIVNLTNWSMGSFSGASWEQVRTAALLCLAGLLAAGLLSKPMAVYALGEGYAQSMGIRVKRFRLALILLRSRIFA